VSKRLDDAVWQAVADCDEIDENTMVTGFVVLASFVTPDGTTHLFSDTQDDQTCHQTLGLLSFALAVENRRAADSMDE
jgi:hypothetical protein